MNYYIGVQGVQSGPFSEAVIREKIARGEIPAGALCWVEGWPEWRSVASVFPVGEVAPTPPPMPPAGFRVAPPAVPPAYTGPTETSGLAITSLITGVLGLLIFIPAIPAVICGHIACSKIKASAGRVTGRGMAITGLVLGYLMIAMMPVGLLAAMAIPAFQKVRANSQEKMIQNNLRQLDAAAQQYMLENGTQTARYSDLVGTEGMKYIPMLTPAAGEDYTGLVIRDSDKVITVTTADGREVTYQRFYSSDRSSF
jgi:hypothetical protein